MGAKNIWDEITEEERKQVRFWLLNRYASPVKGDPDKQELAVFKTNEYYNKNYMEVSKHPKLQWQLLCMSGSQAALNIVLGLVLRKKHKTLINLLKLLSKYIPNMKQSEVELLAGISHQPRTPKNLQKTQH